MKPAQATSGLDVTYMRALPAKIMEHHPWQKRARAAGLSQRTLAKLLGHAEITVSRQLRGHWESGTPDHVVSAILAWEIMTPAMRDEWIAAVEDVRRAPMRREGNEAKPE